MVWADVDANGSPNQLFSSIEKQLTKGKPPLLTQDEFNQIVFVFAHSRIENWIEFLNQGKTNEETPGPRVDNDEVAMAARKLAKICSDGDSLKLPTSLAWSCKNWKALTQRMAE
jgi:hypothetical protein